MSTLNEIGKPIRMRAATPADTALVLSFIRSLADYEKLSHEVVATEDELRRALFGPRPSAEAVLVELEGVPVGFAIFFTSFSTFLAKPGLYLEDLFIEPSARGKGCGEALLRHLAGIARERGYGRFEWSVLDWNEPAIGFYRRLGAVPMSDWTVFRVAGENLDKLADARPSS